MQKQPYLLFQVSIELFETLKVLASQPGDVFQSDYLGLT